MKAPPFRSGQRMCHEGRIQWDIGLSLILAAWSSLACASEPEVRWTLEVGGRIYASPVVVDGGGPLGRTLLAVSSTRRKVICFDARRQVRWTYDEFAARLTTTPTVADLDKDGEPEILLGCRHRGIVCLDASGHQRWQQPVPGGIAWSDVKVADLDRDGRPEVCSLSRLGLVECRRADGTRVLSFQIPQASDKHKTDCPLAVGDADGDGWSEILAPGPQALHCLGPGATEEWNRPFVSRPSSGPVIADLGHGRSRILIATADGMLYCLDAKTGTTVWNHRTFDVRIDSSIVVGDLDGDGAREVVYGDGKGLLHCLDGDGRERWYFRAGDWIENAPAIGDLDGDEQVELVFGSADGKVYCLDSRGSAEWVFPTGKRVSAGPALCDFEGDGYPEVLIASHNGKVYCLAAKRKGR